MNMNYIPSKPNGQNGYINDNENDADYLVVYPHELPWCKNCVHYGWVDTYNACADGNWFQILRNGPLAVSYCGWCRHFVNKNLPEGKLVQYSKFKQKLLSGMNFKQDREK